MKVIFKVVRSRDRLAIILRDDRFILYRWMCRENLFNWGNKINIIAVSAVISLSLGQCYGNFISFAILCKSSLMSGDRVLPRGQRCYTYAGIYGDDDDDDADDYGDDRHILEK